MVRDGIKTMLVTQADKYEFDISEAENSETAFEKIWIENFDIVLMDYQLPDVAGPDAVIRILRQKPNTKILALSNYDEYTCISNMINAGAKGYVLKNISPDELTVAIEAILTGDIYYAKEISEKIDISKRERIKHKSQLAKYGVTERQIEILKLISIGMTNEEISTKLKLAKRTIDTHRQNLLVKLGVNNTAALIKKATDLSILE
jgi:DNA-binding NarL/FixJ family response regulator